MTISVEKRFLSLLLVFSIVFLLLPLTPIEAWAAAGETITVDDLTATHTSDGNTAAGVFTFEGNTLTISEKATSSSGCGSTTYTAQTSEVTLRNDTGADIKLKFSGSVTGGGSATIGGNAFSSGMEINLAAGGAVVITVTSAKSADEAKLTLTIERGAVDTVAIKFLAPENGSYTVDDEEITAETTKNNSAAKIYNLVAEPAIGYSFFGWLSKTADAETYVSYTDTYETKFDAPTTIQPIFVKSETAIFAVGSDEFFDLGDAVTAAETASKKVIVLKNHGTLAAGNYTIPSGVTLLIPYDDANTIKKEEPNRLESYSKPTVYKKLTMSEGANLTINGSLNVGGSQTGEYKYNGCVSGPVGSIDMNPGSNIYIENGATLFAWGYITGSGSVEAKNGATVYESFQLMDYRGGSDTSSLAQDKTHGFFPA